MDNQQILVSIKCLAYNHEPYIRECLEGFVMQKTNFRFEAIVHDDASTDGTADIIREYAEKYPDIIKPIFETENQYSKHDGSLGRIMNEACTGKYIAMCEGDDYWTDPLKLQKQVDFLEEHEDYSLCCSKAKVFVQEKLAFEGEKGSRDCEAYDSIIRGYNDINTASAVFNNAMYLRCRSELESFLPSELRIDTAIWYWFARNGKIKFFDDCLSVYRVLPNSACHSTNQEKRMQNDLDFIKLKLFFLSHYPLKDAESNGAFISVLMEEVKSVCDFARYLGEQKVRQTKAFEIGNRIKRFLPFNLK